jgi:phage terminase large subunit GpA-like protein
MEVQNKPKQRAGNKTELSQNKAVIGRSRYLIVSSASAKPATPSQELYTAGFYILKPSCGEIGEAVDTS